MKVKNLGLLFFVIFLLNFLFPRQVQSQARMESDNFRITWPNLNMIGGNTTSPGFQMGVTGGQTAPGLYSSLGYKIRAGFQYIHSIIPFSFRLSDTTLAFGILTSQVLTNEKTLTLTVNSGSASGYQVTVRENDELTSTALSTIPDTACDDPADTCTQNDSGTWTQTNTYGFGYNMTGTDIPNNIPSESFTGNKFKRFPNATNIPVENPVKIMGLTPAEGHKAEKNKEAVMTARINIDPIQAAGVYRNVLTFTAIPTY